MDTTDRASDRMGTVLSAEGGTLLTFTTWIGDPEIGPDSAAGYHVCLDRLETWLDTERGAPLLDHPVELEARYRAGRGLARRHGMSDIAALLDGDGRWTLRFERHLAHPVEKVWRAVTEPVHRDAWFPQRIEGDLVPGGKLRFVDDPNLPAEGWGGRCVAIEPPNLLELEWGDDVVRIELAPEGDGTRLVFLDTLDERRHAARTGAGWHECLEHLTAHLDGSTVPEMTETRWDELHGRYLDAVGGERHVWGSTPT